MDVLVLNADFNCINNISWKRALNLISSGKVEVIKYSDRTIRNFTNTFEFKIPKVIRLLRFVSSVYRAKVPFHKKSVFVRDKFTCQYCGSKSRRLTIDHVIPVSKGGDTSWKNCVTACEQCNVKKSDKLLDTIPHMKLKTIPHEPNIITFYKHKYSGFDIADIGKWFGDM